MRLSKHHIGEIHAVVREEAGETARARVFGSRVRDESRGGDLDLLVEIAEPAERPAWLSARISARVSRLLGGRAVDVVLDAPNLRHLPVHDVARQEGVTLW